MPSGKVAGVGVGESACQGERESGGGSRKPLVMAASQKIESILEDMEKPQSSQDKPQPTDRQEQRGEKKEKRKQNSNTCHPERATRATPNTTAIQLPPHPFPSLSALQPIHQPPPLTPLNPSSPPPPSHIKVVEEKKSPPPLPPRRARRAETDAPRRRSRSRARRAGAGAGAGGARRLREPLQRDLGGVLLGVVDVFAVVPEARGVHGAVDGHGAGPGGAASCFCLLFIVSVDSEEKRKGREKGWAWAVRTSPIRDDLEDGGGDVVVAAGVWVDGMLICLRGYPRG